MISSTGNAWSPRIPTVNSRPGINFSTRISGPNRATSAIAASISRSEEHTSELQSQSNIVCRLLLEKKKNPLRPPLADHSMPVESADFSASKRIGAGGVSTDRRDLNFTRLMHRFPPPPDDCLGQIFL